MKLLQGMGWVLLDSPTASEYEFLSKVVKHSKKKIQSHEKYPTEPTNWRFVPKNVKKVGYSKMDLKKVFLTQSDQEIQYQFIAGFEK